MIKISEIFESLQGEGFYAGEKMLFIRTSGCTRACSWCDTKYHKDGVETDIESIIEQINDFKGNIICWTGGEPLLQIKAIREIIKRTESKVHHIETNGDLLKLDIFYDFDYVAISPKEKEVAKKVFDMIPENWAEHCFDIKIVTDLDKVGVDILQYATRLMPLSTYDEKKDRAIQQKLWEYCVEHDVTFSPRLHTYVWGNMKSI